MKTEDIIKYLKLQDSNLDFYKREINENNKYSSDEKTDKRSIK